MRVTSEAHSGVAPITVNDRGNSSVHPSPPTPPSLLSPGENCIVIVSGANLKLAPDDVQQATHLIAGSKVMVCQLEVPQETSLEALCLAKQNNGIYVACLVWFNVVPSIRSSVVTIFNTAPGAILPDSFFKVTDILVLNETEV